MAEPSEPLPSSLPTATNNNDTASSSSPATQLFWETQPVMQVSDADNTELLEGPILPRNPDANLQTNPQTLPSQFEWTSIDVEDDDDFSNLHRFITANYVDDSCPIHISFTYSPAFLRWLLLAPNHIKSLHVAVRVKNTKKLVGFIAGLPSSVRVKRNILPMAIANLLCVHKKLRSKRLAPVLIRELVRRANSENIWQGIYATEVQHTLPFCSSEWLERLLNPKKLMDLDYLTLKPTITPKLVVKMCKLPKVTDTIGFRKMRVPQDVAAVAGLLRKQLKNLPVALQVDEQFVEHFVVPKEGVVESFVVENPETSTITDFCSFVMKEMKIKNNAKYSELKCGILFYYAAFKTPARKLMKDLLVMAKGEGCDLFRAQGIMGNSDFLFKLFFRVTHEEKMMNYYLYNYRLTRKLLPMGFGIIML